MRLPLRLVLSGQALAVPPSRKPQALLTLVARGPTGPRPTLIARSCHPTATSGFKTPTSLGFKNPRCEAAVAVCPVLPPRSSSLSAARDAWPAC